MSTITHFFTEWRDHDGVWHPVGDVNSFYDGNNPILFAFFGLPHPTRATSTKIQPIVEPSGLPLDCSHFVREKLQNPLYYCHNYVTVAALLNANWDQPLNVHGLITVEEYGQWAAHRQEPRSFYKVIPSPDYVSLREKDFVAGKYHPEMNVLIQVEWQKSLADFCARFLLESMPHLCNQARNVGGVDNLRCVFAFEDIT